MTTPNPASVRETDHPYYGTPGCYWAPGYDQPHETHESWAEFVGLMGNADLDLNLLYRWDWVRPDPADYEPGEEMPGERLELFYMQQRKARPWSHYVAVTPEDEPAVREWLRVRAEHLAAVWDPFLAVKS